MLSAETQSELIDQVADSEGFVSEEFHSASGIDGNFKIELPEAMRRNPLLLSKIAGYMVAELEKYRVNMVVATGGAVELGRSVACLADWEFVEIGSRRNDKGKKEFFLPDIYDIDTINRQRIGFVEDVSSTWGTVSRALEQTEIKKPAIGVSGWRRGVKAPPGMKNGSIRAHNIANNTLPPLEEKVGFTKRGIINRSVPLYVVEGTLQDWIPEAPIDL